MSIGALVFMLCSWGLVLGLTGWSFHRLLTGKRTMAPADAETGETRHLGAEPTLNVTQANARHGARPSID